MGPIAAALAGGAAGAVGGGLIGALIGVGIPEDRAKRYDQGIREGNIVIGVTPRSEEDAELIAIAWIDCGGEEIYRPSRREAA